jgi:integrase
MDQNQYSPTHQRIAWNKGKLIGAKPPLSPKHVWSIRTKLQVEGELRDLALFNLAIDSKLRGCDVIGLKVEDIAPNGYAVERATVRQKKTGQPVRFELTEQTRQAVDEYVRAFGRSPVISCFRAVGMVSGLLPYANMQDWSINGWRALGWMRTVSERILLGEPKRV